MVFNFAKESFLMSLVLKNRNSENQNRENPDTMEISETSKEGSASRSQNSSLPEKKGSLCYFKFGFNFYHPFQQLSPFIFFRNR